MRTIKNIIYNSFSAENLLMFFGIFVIATIILFIFNSLLVSIYYGVLVTIVLYFFDLFGKYIRVVGGDEDENE